MVKCRKILHINFMLFFVGWVIVFLLGADFPPPVGFIWMVLLIFVLDIIQTFYLKKYFLTHIDEYSKTKLFFMNALFYFAGSLAVALLTSIPNLLSIGAFDPLIWILVVITVGVLYGMAFWLFNILLFRSLK